MTHDHLDFLRSVSEAYKRSARIGRENEMRNRVETKRREFNRRVAEAVGERVAPWGPRLVPKLNLHAIEAEVAREMAEEGR